MICNAFDVLIVPFPYADRPVARLRPAVALTSHDAFNRHSGIVLMAMVSVALASHWPLDTPLVDPAHAGLDRECLVRMKVMGIDLRLIDRKVGTLCADDRANVGCALAQLFPFATGT